MKIKQAPSGADLGGGCEGCAPPPPPEMTCGFLIQLVFCKKNYVAYWCWSRAKDECTPPQKNPGSAPDLELLFSYRYVLFAEICSWCNSKKLTLHTGKSEVMILQRSICWGPILPVQFGNTVLKYTYSTWVSVVIGWQVALEGPSAWNVPVIL